MGTKTRRAGLFLAPFILILALATSAPFVGAGEARSSGPALAAFPESGPLQSVSISGPTSGSVNTAYTFVATAAPPTATLPIAHVWRATEQGPSSYVGGLTSTVTYTWTLPGTKVITVTASNNPLLNAVMTTHTVTIHPAGIPPTQITWYAATHGPVNQPFWMTAVVDPFSLTLPVTYTWAADGQVVYTMTRQTLYDWAWYGNHGLYNNSTYAAFTWTTPMVHVVQLTATNAAGRVSSIREVIVGVAPTLVLSGPGTGQVNHPYTFTATASPPTVTTPIWYFWNATEQAFTMTVGGLTSTMTYTWTTPGNKAIAVWGQNTYGSNFAGKMFQIPAPMPVLTPTLHSVASGPWNSPGTWNLGRAPLVTDVVWIQAGHTVQVGGPVVVASLVNEGTLLGPTSGHLVLTVTGVLSNSGLIRAGDGAGLLAHPSKAAPQWHPACNGTSGNPGANVVVSAAQTINSGTIQAGNGLNGGIGGSVTWAPSPVTTLRNTASGVIQAGNGGNGQPGGGGGPGGDVNLTGKPFDNDGLIRAGDGGDGDQCGGDGGSTHIWGENTTNTGNILAGNGGNTTDNLATAHGGDGGDAVVWGKWFTWQGFLINLGNIAAGNGGNGNPGATVPQDAGCGGNLTLMAAPLVFLSGGTHSAGIPGIPSAGGRECTTPSQVWIDPAAISLAGEDTRIRGDDISIYGGAGWELDLRGMAEGAIQAAGHITVAVGPGGTIDLRHNRGPIFQAGGEVRIYADQVLMDPGVPLWALAGTEVITGPGRILYGPSLVAPDLIPVAPGSVVLVPVTLLNTSPTTDTFDLSATDSAGWPLSGLPAQVTVGGLGHADLVVQVDVPAGAPDGSVDEVTVQAASQSDPGAVTEVESLVLVRSPFLVQVFLPLVVR
ncbi:MAG: hypothetical protein ACPL7G_10165 [Chloroflexia bacterium]